MLVRDIMTELVQFVAPEATVREALTIFEDEEIRHLPVMAEDKLVGMISDRDLHALRKVYEAPGESVMDSPIRDYMHTDVLSLKPDSTVVAAIDLLVHLRIGAAPVLSAADELVGIVSYVDILEAAREHF